MQFWKRPSKTTGAEHETAIARSSSDWAGEIRKLTAELDENAVRRATAVVESGRATLDQQHAKASDLAATIRTLDTRREIVEAAIAAAQDRQADAESDEQRRHLTLKARVYYGQLAAWCTARATLRDAETAWSAAQRDYRTAVSGLMLADDFQKMRRDGVSVPPADDFQEIRDSGQLRAEAQRFEQLAETFTIGGEAGEAAELEQQIEALDVQEGVAA